MGCFLQEPLPPNTQYPSLNTEMAWEKSTKTVVLTGAGISAESGIPTFRGEDGLWKNYRAEELATPQAFERDHETVWEWYDWRRGKIAAAKPNAGHRAIAALEDHFEDLTLVTQNVDGLHGLAGSKRVLELHGNIWKRRCTSCGEIGEDRSVPMKNYGPRCSCGSLLRPHIVWFGESLPADVLAGAFACASACRLMLVVGTSGIVHPAASLPLTAKEAGATVIEVNPEETPLTPMMDESIRGSAGEALPKLLERNGIGI